MDFFPQFFDFGGVFGFNHALRENAQFFSRKLALTREFKSKMEHARLFCTRQVFDFFNDICRCHVQIIAENGIVFKRKGGNVFFLHAWLDLCSTKGILFDYFRTYVAH